MIDRLASLLKVRPEERRLVVLVAVLFACIQAGQGMGDNAASALFLLRYGVDFLPYMYIFLGALTFLTTLAYSAALGRFDKGSFFSWLMAGFIGLLLLERAAILFTFPLLYPVLWLTISGLGLILGTFTWNLAGLVTDARQAKRLFPLFTSAGILGSVGGNAITGFAARLFGTDNLLIVYALLLGIAFSVTRQIARNHIRREQALQERSNFWEDLRTGYDFVRRSRLMQLVAYASVLFSVLFFSLSFPFSKVVTASFADEAGVAGFLGLFNSLATLATFLVSLFLASRIFARIGIINGVFLMPLTYMFSFAIFSIYYELGGAAIARFAQLVILTGVASTAWNALFNVVPSQKRGQVLAFNNGLPSQIGVALSGILLIVGENYLTVRQIFFMGVVVALLCGVLVWRMRRAYAGALVDALRAGRVEVFSAGDSTFQELEADPAALQVAIQSLDDPKPGTRRLGAEMLGRMESDAAIPHLTRLLSDPEPPVRAAAIASLGVLYADSASAAILPLLDDPDEQVREQALAVLPRLRMPDKPGLVQKISSLVRDDPSLAVQGRAIAALARLGAVQAAASQLSVRLESGDTRTRYSALETAAEAGPYLYATFDLQPILRALEDPSAIFRRQAVRALANMEGDSICRRLLAALDDPDEGVRRAAAEALRRRAHESRALVLELFETESPAVDAALDALAPGDSDSLEPLRGYASRELARARILRSQYASLPSSSAGAVRFLRDRLRTQASLCEGRLIKTVGLFGDMRTMDLVHKSMNATSIENRATALEALDTIGDKKLAGSIVALLEEDSQPAEPSDVVAALLKSPDPWLRTLAIRSTSELGLREFIPLLHQLKTGPDPRLGEAARGALSQFGEEEPMDTLKTVTILERILLLREIPIFADLSPEDLQLVAETAQEAWYPQDTVVFRQGEEGSVMYVIVEGELDVLHRVNDSEELLVRRGPGDFVGEMAVIESAPRSASLRTRSDVRVLSIDGETFKGILRERPEVSFAVLRNLSRRLREMTE